MPDSDWATGEDPAQIAKHTVCGGLCIPIKKEIAYKLTILLGLSMKYLLQILRFAFRNVQRTLGLSMKYLLQILYFACIVLGLCSCSSWHQAEEVLAYADSLDTHQHIIYQDTTALQVVVDTWDKPLVRVLKHDDLGRAYYYLGCNYEDLYQDYSSAAEFFIRSDQLRMSDPIMRGRAKSSLLNICSNNLKQNLAIKLAKSALKYYQQSNDSIMIAHGLLNLAQLHRILKQNQCTDSLLSLVHNINLDSTTLARFYAQKGYCFYDAHQYDSSLLYFHKALSISEYHRNNEYSYHMLMKSHFRLQHIDSAAYYANVLIQYPSAYLRADACYALIEHARVHNDAEAVAKYAHLRADMQQEMKTMSMERDLGAQKVSQHYEEERHFVSRIIKIVTIIFLIIALSALLVYSIHKRLIRAQQEISDREDQIREMEKNERHRREVKIKAIEISIDKHQPVFAFDSKIWFDDRLLCNKADECLFNLYTRLNQQYKIDLQDLKICILCLYEASRSNVADCIGRSITSIPKLRSITAKKLGTTYPNLRATLLEYLAS